MSSQSPSPFTSAPQRQPAWSWKVQNFTTPQNFSARSTSGKKGQSVTAARASQEASSSKDAEQSTPAVTSATNRTQNTRKRRKLNHEEEEIKRQTAKSIAMNLEMDQLSTLYPDADTPFVDEIDTVNRLLPYHIYHHPKHDLDMIRGKGKSKITQEDLLREEIRETKFALECHKRYGSLERRMRRIRLKAGQDVSPHGQVIALERLVLEADHTTTSILDQELSAARLELDKILRAKKAAKAASIGRQATNQPASSFYGFPTPTFATTTTPNLAQYYNSYTYPYGQTYVPGTTYSGHANSAKYMQPVPGVSAFQTSSVPSTQATQASTPFTANLTAQSPTETHVRPPSVAIPLQIPVTSLPALQALGILPVPKAALPSASEPQPPAVLLGSTNNGSMLSLEINAALLQAPQMSGLAILLSSLVKMSGGSAANQRKDGPSSTHAQGVGAGATSTAAPSRGGGSHPTPSNAASADATK